MISDPHCPKCHTMMYYEHTLSFLEGIKQFKCPSCHSTMYLPDTGEIYIKDRSKYTETYINLKDYKK